MDLMFSDGKTDNTQMNKHIYKYEKSDGNKVHGEN